MWVANVNKNFLSNGYAISCVIGEECWSLEQRLLSQKAGPPFPPPVYVPHQAKPRWALSFYQLTFLPFSWCLDPFQMPFVKQQLLDHLTKIQSCLATLLAF